MLKQKLRQAESAMFKKDEEFAALQRSIGATKLDECNVQLKLAEAECIRLRGIINELLVSKDEKYLNEFRELKDKILRQSTNMKELEKINSELSSKLSEQTFDNEKLKEQINNFENKMLKELVNSISMQKDLILTSTEKFAALMYRISTASTKLKKYCEYSQIFETTRSDLEFSRQKIREFAKSLEVTSQDLVAKNELIKAKNKALERQEEIRLRVMQENEQLRSSMAQCNPLLTDSGGQAEGARGLQSVA